MLIIVRLISDNINVPIKKAVFIHSVTTSSVNFTNNAQFSIIDEKNSHSLFLILKKVIFKLFGANYIPLLQSFRLLKS